MDRIKPGRWSRQGSLSISLFILLTPFLSVILLSCGSKAEIDDNPGMVLVDFDKSNPELLLRYYIGAYLSEHEQDAFEAGYVRRIEGKYYIDRNKVGQSPLLSRLITDGYVEDRVLDWDEFSTFIQDTYYQSRAPSPDRAALYEVIAFRSGDSSWFKVDVRGVMTTSLRRVYVKERALRAALGAYLANGRRLVYPTGTTFIGEHRMDSTLVETTVMSKRPDGLWDFMVYGADGKLVRETNTPPKKLKAPIQCFGCHTGTKLFEPEKSFPGFAKDGPHGPRALYVDDGLRNEEVAAFFDEHRKRSDMVLGIYNTLFVSRLLEMRRAGALSEEDEALLNDLGL
ncbi:hypothetical protein [Rhodocaloribacter sp.]